MRHWNNVNTKIIKSWGGDSVGHYDSASSHAAESFEHINFVVTYMKQTYPDSKVHGANMGPTLVLSALDGPHVGPMNFAIWVIASRDVH